MDVGKIMSNIPLPGYLNFYADCYHVYGRNRQYGDLRDDVSSYTIVNVSMMAKKILKGLKGYEGLDLRVSVHNLFNSSDQAFGF